MGHHTKEIWKRIVTKSETILHAKRGEVISEQGRDRGLQKARR